MPAEMLVTLLRPPTCAGVERSVVVPSPSWPLLLLPQAQTAPSPRRARACAEPPAMLVTLLRPPTCAGVERSVVVPSPSWPLLLLPQAQTAPSPRRARE